MTLAARFAPVSFEKVRGQDKAVRLFSGIVLGTARPHILLHGAYGAGKTTLVRIFAKALNCSDRNPDTGSPCNQTTCPTCSNPAEYFTEFDVPKQTQTGRLIEQIHFTLIAPSPGLQQVVFLDEAQALQRTDSELLLKTLESLEQGPLFVLATTEPWRLSLPLRSRFQPVAVDVLSLSSSIRFLEEVSRIEQLKIQDEILVLVAAVAKGHPRDLLHRLDSVSHHGSQTAAPLTIAEARTRLGLDSDVYLVGYFDALSAASSQGAQQLLHDWPADWEAKARWTQSFCLLLYYDILGLDVFVDPMVDIISLNDRRRICSAFQTKWHLQTGFDLRHPWTTILAVWSTPVAGLSDAAIRILFAQFEQLIASSLPSTAASGDEVPPSLSVTAVTAVTSDRHPADEIGHDDGFLRLQHVNEIVSRASYFVQHSGRGLNFSFSFYPAPANRVKTVLAIASIEAFTDALFRRHPHRNPYDTMAMIRLLERDSSGVYAHFVGYFDDVRHNTKYESDFVDWATSCSYKTTNRQFCPVGNRKPSLAFHWKTIARLCSSLSRDEWPPAFRASLGVRHQRPSSMIPPPHPLVRFYGDTSFKLSEAANESGSAFVSAVADKRWDFIGGDWELHEAVYRQKMRMARAEFEGSPVSTHAIGSGTSIGPLSNALKDTSEIIARTWTPWWTRDA